MVKDALETGTLRRLETDLSLPGGGFRSLRITCVPLLSETGEVREVLGITHDFTERRQAERAVRESADEIRRLNADLERRVEERTAELKAANEELEGFAYAVSHDLRAPLRAMAGFSQALVEDHGGRLDGEARLYLDQITLASRKMGELIDGILQLSRVTRGELRRDVVDLSSMAGRILEGLARAEPARFVSWRVEPGLTAAGDSRMLEVVLTNLLGNAWKYTAMVPLPAIRVYSDRENGARVFCVSDNGVGFDMAHSEKLFQPFQRLHRQDEFPGLGIGLATVQRIVHRHGGEIRAAGAVGRGATFRFSLESPTARAREVS
jgi:light-regulated signal transduction histidine kinase (bacteriophytochrome)